MTVRGLIPGGSARQAYFGIRLILYGYSAYSGLSGSVESNTWPNRGWLLGCGPSWVSGGCSPSWGSGHRRSGVLDVADQPDHGARPTTGGRAQQGASVEATFAAQAVCGRDGRAGWLSRYTFISAGELAAGKTALPPLVAQGQTSGLLDLDCRLRELSCVQPRVRPTDGE
jgi:hypothetical protein